MKKSNRVKVFFVLFAACYNNPKKAQLDFMKGVMEVLWKEASDVHAACRMNPLMTFTKRSQHKPVPDPR